MREQRSRFADLVDEGAQVRAASVELAVIIVFAGLLLGIASNQISDWLRQSTGAWSVVGWTSVMLALALTVVAAHRANHVRRLNRSERWELVLPLVVAPGRFEIGQPAGHHGSRIAAEAVVRTSRTRSDFVETFTRAWTVNRSSGSRTPLDGDVYDACCGLVHHVLLRVLVEFGQDRFTSKARYHGTALAVPDHVAIEGPRLATLCAANIFDTDWLATAPQVKLRVSPGTMVHRASSPGSSGCLEVKSLEGTVRFELGPYWTPLHRNHRTSRIVRRRGALGDDDPLLIVSIPVTARLSLISGWWLLFPSRLKVWLGTAEALLLRARNRLDWAAYDEHEIERTIPDLERRIDLLGQPTKDA